MQKLTQEQYQKISEEVIKIAYKSIQIIKLNDNNNADTDTSLYDTMATIAVSCSMATYQNIAEALEKEQKENNL